MEKRKLFPIPKFFWDEDDDEEDCGGPDGPMEMPVSREAVDLTLAGLRYAVETGEITNEQAETEFHLYYPNELYYSVYLGKSIRQPLAYDSEGCYFDRESEN